MLLLHVGRNLQDKRRCLSLDKMRKNRVAEIERLKTAMEKTDSEYLKRDYGKALKRIQRELSDYDRYKGGA